MSELFDDNDNMNVPLEAVFDVIMEKNKQLTLEVATLQTGNRILRNKIRELESKLDTAKNVDVTELWESK